MSANQIAVRAGPYALNVDLPVELQIKIFKFAVDDVKERYITLTNRFKDALYGIKEWKYTHIYTSDAPTPALLHVCRLSREIALERWQLAFPGSGEGPRGWNRRLETYVDPTTDTLLFTRYPLQYPFHQFSRNVVDLMKSQLTSMRLELRPLIVGADGKYITSLDNRGYEFAQEIHDQFPNLKSLVLAHDSSLDYPQTDLTRRIRSRSWATRGGIILPHSPLVLIWEMFRQEKIFIDAFLRYMTCKCSNCKVDYDRPDAHPFEASYQRIAFSYPSYY